FLGTPDEARALAESALRQRDSRAASLAKLRPEPSAEVVIRTLESISVEADGSAVTGRARIPGDLPAAPGQVVPPALGHALGEALGHALVPLITAVVVGVYIILGTLALLGVGTVAVLMLVAARAQGRE